MEEELRQESALNFKWEKAIAFWKPGAVREITKLDLSENSRKKNGPVRTKVTQSYTRPKAKSALFFVVELSF